MSQPFRRFCFALAERLGKSLAEVMSWNSKEIVEWMGFSMTQNDTWMANYKTNLELKRQEALTPEELSAEFRRGFGAPS